MFNHYISCTRIKHILRSVFLFLMLISQGKNIPVFAQSSSGSTELISIHNTSIQARLSSFSDISDDGRYVAFESFDNTLVSGDTNDTDDVFLRDRQTGVIERISISSNEEQGSGEDSYSYPSISSDGRFVAFDSMQYGLVPNDTNGLMDVFIRDRQSGVTELISVSSSGEQGTANSGGPSISSDGRFVVFSSSASNLVPGDTNGVSDIFIRDRQSGTTELVSGFAMPANSSSSRPSISADGRFVVFSSRASNLVPDDTNMQEDIFLFDRQSGLTERISIASDGTQGNNYSWGWKSAVSMDGRYVVFGSYSSNLIPGDTNNTWDVFIRDRQNATTEIASISTEGTQGNGLSYDPVISPDGRYIVFESNANNLVAGDTNGDTDIFIRDRQEQFTERVSLSDDGAQGVGPVMGSFLPSISADGRFISFTSDATNLVFGDTNDTWDVFVRDREGSPYGHFISGKVTESGDNPVAGVTISNNAGHTTVTGTDGTYLLSGLSSGKYTISAFKPGAQISPSTLTVTIPPDATEKDFNATIFPAASPPPANINITDSTFAPYHILLFTGQELIWANNSMQSHTITEGVPPYKAYLPILNTGQWAGGMDGEFSVFPQAYEPLFHSGPIAPGETFSYIFNSPGDYTYYSQSHSSRQMGTVHVISAGESVQTSVSAGADIDLSVPSGARISVAATSVLDSTKVTIIEAPDPGYAEPGDISLSSAYDFRIENFHDVIDGPVSITIPYDPALVPEGTLPSQMGISSYNGAGWIFEGGTVNTSNHTITASVRHLSFFKAINMWWDCGTGAAYSSEQRDAYDTARSFIKDIYLNQDIFKQLTTLDGHYLLTLPFSGKAARFLADDHMCTILPRDSDYILEKMGLENANGEIVVSRMITLGRALRSNGDDSYAMNKVYY